MKKIKTNGVSALGTTPVYASQLNAIVESLGVTNDGPSIPENVYPVADGEGGFLAGDIKITGSRTEYGNIAIGASSLSNIETGYANTAVGRYTGINIVSGNENTFVGDSAGSDDNNQLVTAIASIAIGNASYTTKNLQAVFGRVGVLETITRGVHINTRSTLAVDAADTLTPAEVLSGVITSVATADDYSITLPTATEMMTVLTNGGSTGTTFDLYIYNYGTKVITLVLGTRMSTIQTPVITGTNTLTVSAGNASVANVAKFTFICTLATTGAEQFKVVRVF